MKYVVGLSLAVLVAVVALGSSGAAADRDACVSRIEATNNAAGVQTDYRGAYRTCRNQD